MTTREARGLAAADTEEEAIAGYLQHNPEFFERHQAVLARLRLPHARGGSTISLVERQIEVLREKQAALEDRSWPTSCAWRAPTMPSPRSCIASRAGCCAPRRAPRPSRSIEASLREDFDAFHAVLVLIGTRDRAGPAGASCARCAPMMPTSKSFESLFTSGKPRCGQARDSQREFLFGARGAGHRLGGAGAAGRAGLAGTAGAGQRRSRPLPPGHEHRVPRAPGGSHHRRARAP